jgi:hypothetical protein
LAVELLESRDLPSVAVPMYLINHGGLASPMAGGTSPTGTTPNQIRHAYGIDQIKFGSVVGDGSGATIAIVDAFDDPNLVSSTASNFNSSDLHNFDLKFNLSDPVFTKINQSGGTSMPSADSGWASEIALDVEWAHATAPKANILLVEANDNSFTNLLNAVKYAAGVNGVVAVSMSWGGGEFSGESSYDSYFTTPSGHGGVTFLAASGDSGAPPIYPAISPNVVAVGGTTLNMDLQGNILSETGWSGSGGGLSAVESQPSYQKGVVSQSSTARANPDVAYDADPNTGFPVYDSYNGGSAPWYQFGGTSDAAPQWAGIMAIVAQGRGSAGSLDGATQTLPKLYGLSSADYHDITSGTSTGFPTYSARTGYDLVTGLGTPVANKIVADLVGSSAPAVSKFSVTTSASTVTAGTAFDVTVTAQDSNGNKVTGYTGTIHFTSSDPNAILPADYTFTSSDAGVHTFSLGVTLKKAGSQTVTATDTGSSSVTGSATLSVNPASANQLAFGQQPTNTAPGATISPAVTVSILDKYGNVLTGDSTDTVIIAISTNPSGGTLSGTTSVTVSNGVATFNNLSIDKAGSGYKLTASSGSLSSVVSAAFNITASTVLEDFESTRTWNVAGGSSTSMFSRTTAAAHDGAYGLQDTGGTTWIYRNDSAATVSQNENISVWVYFSGAADGRAYFGFGAGTSGALVLCAAPNSSTLLLMTTTYSSYTTLASVSQTYAANHWYLMQVAWFSNGNITGRLYDSDGATLLASVSATNTSITSGGFGFRTIGSTKYFDTVQMTAGANLGPIGLGGRAPDTPGMADNPASNGLPVSRTTAPVAPVTSTVILIDVTPVAGVVVPITTAGLATLTPSAAPSPATLFLAPAYVGEGGRLAGGGVDAAAAADNSSGDNSRDNSGFDWWDSLFSRSPAEFAVPAAAILQNEAGDQQNWEKISEALFDNEIGSVAVDREEISVLRASVAASSAERANLAAAAGLVAALGVVWAPAVEAEDHQSRGYIGRRIWQ